MGKIFTTTRCYCCDEMTERRNVKKPTMRGKIFIEVKCENCQTVNSYRITRQNAQDLLVETIRVQASELGQKIYKERTGEDLKAKYAGT